MNSLLQALARCPSFRESISRSKHVLSSTLHRIFGLMDDPNVLCVDVLVMEQLQQFFQNDDFDTSNQDVHEWFVGRFCCLPDARCFKGVEISALTCQQCNAVKKNREPFFCLDLAITTDTVQRMLDDHLRHETLNGENSYQCGTCNAKTEARKQLSIEVSESQSVLVILLKRWNNKQKKINTIVDPFADQGEINVNKTVFAAVALCCHVTRNGADHYITYVKTKSGIKCCDDERITSVTSGWKKGSYVCFYVRK